MGLRLDAADRIGSEYVRTCMQTTPVRLKMREQRLRWFERVPRRPQSHSIRGVRGSREATVRSPKEERRDVIKKDLAKDEDTAEDAVDRMKWRC
ncbi:unnamed protein product [Haemonchus placei]|uniref:Uncharacterized protein n=1 Tax=Haemonchus placei TaxID=6290 RepID=A0A0N4W5G2_HAEPC|nr:unnamed protein product [Haemonchus placei]